MRIADHQALTFDCYGTLIDWEEGIACHLEAWAAVHGLAISRERLLGLHARFESELETEMPAALYSEILAGVHWRIAAELGIDASHSGGPAAIDPNVEARDFAASVAAWPAFPDTPAALATLKSRYKLVVISNVDRRSFAGSARRLGVELDAVVTAEEVGAYKPDHRLFERAFEVLAEMGIERSGILHVAQSLYHDHVPARALGLHTVWVDRRRGRQGFGATPPPSSAVRSDITVAGLAELVELDDRQRAR